MVPIETVRCGCDVSRLQKAAVVPVGLHAPYAGRPTAIDRGGPTSLKKIKIITSAALDEHLSMASDWTATKPRRLQVYLTQIHHGVKHSRQHNTGAMASEERQCQSTKHGRITKQPPLQCRYVRKLLLATTPRRRAVQRIATPRPASHSAVGVRTSRKKRGVNGERW